MTVALLSEQSMLLSALSAESAGSASVEQLLRALDGRQVTAEVLSVAATPEGESELELLGKTVSLKLPDNAKAGDQLTLEVKARESGVELKIVRSESPPTPDPIREAVSSLLKTVRLDRATLDILKSALETRATPIPQGRSGDLGELVREQEIDLDAILPKLAISANASAYTPDKIAAELAAKPRPELLAALTESLRAEISDGVRATVEDGMAKLEAIVRQAEQSAPKVATASGTKELLSVERPRSELAASSSREQPLSSDGIERLMKIIRAVSPVSDTEGSRPQPIASFATFVREQVGRMSAETNLRTFALDLEPRSNEELLPVLLESIERSLDQQPSAEPVRKVLAEFRSAVEKTFLVRRPEAELVRAIADEGRELLTLDLARVPEPTREPLRELQRIVRLLPERTDRPEPAPEKKSEEALRRFLSLVSSDGPRAPMSVHEAEIRLVPLIDAQDQRLRLSAADEMIRRAPSSSPVEDLRRLTDRLGESLAEPRSADRVAMLAMVNELRRIASAPGGNAREALNALRERLEAELPAGPPLEAPTLVLETDESLPSPKIPSAESSRADNASRSPTEPKEEEDPALSAARRIVVRQLDLLLESPELLELPPLPVPERSPGERVVERNKVPESLAPLFQALDAAEESVKETIELEERLVQVVRDVKSALGEDRPPSERQGALDRSAEELKKILELTRRPEGGQLLSRPFQQAARMLELQLIPLTGPREDRSEPPEPVPRIAVPTPGAPQLTKDAVRDLPKPVEELVSAVRKFSVAAAALPNTPKALVEELGKLFEGLDERTPVEQVVERIVLGVDLLARIDPKAEPGARPLLVPRIDLPGFDLRKLIDEFRDRMQSALDDLAGRLKISTTIFSSSEGAKPFAAPRPPSPGFEERDMRPTVESARSDRPLAQSETSREASVARQAVQNREPARLDGPALQEARAIRDLRAPSSITAANGARDLLPARADLPRAEHEEIEMEIVRALDTLAEPVRERAASTTSTRAPVPTVEMSRDSTPRSPEAEAPRRSEQVEHVLGVLRKLAAEQPTNLRPAEEKVFALVRETLRAAENPKAWRDEHHAETFVRKALSDIQAALSPSAAERAAGESEALRNARDAMRGLENIVRGQEVLQQMAPLFQALGEPTFALFPHLIQGMLSKIELAYYPHTPRPPGRQGSEEGDTPIEEDGPENGGRKKRKSFERVRFHLVLPSLGELEVDFAHTLTEMILTVTCGDPEAGRFLETELPKLEELLKGIGYSTLALRAQIDEPKSTRPAWLETLLVNDDVTA